MTNRYEVPPEDETPLGGPHVRYLGGFLAIGAMGVGFGAIAIAMLDFSLGQPFLFIALVWLIAFSAAMALVPRTSASLGVKALYVLLAAPLGFVLYVPTCTFSALVLEEANVSSGAYPIIASVVTFPLILMLGCWIFRSIMGRKRWDGAPDKREIQL